MKYGSLIIEEKEYKFLKQLLKTTDNYQATVQKKSIEKLIFELESAQIMENSKVPSDVVRLNSEVTIGSSDGWQQTIQVVLPEDGNMAARKISVLLPIGSAVIGYALGDEILWEFPGGAKSIKVINVLQQNLALNNTHKS